MHHIIFRSQGGTHDLENLISLCRFCHDTAHRKNNQDSYPRWELQLMVRLDLRNIKKMRLDLQSVRGPCLSCEHWRADGSCPIWEETYQWDYSCNAWKLRDAHELSSSLRRRGVFVI